MATNVMNKYDTQALEFLKQTNTKFEVKYLRTGKYFNDDKYERDIYQITLTRGTRKYSFDFGQSINCSGVFIAKPYSKIYLTNTVGKICFTDQEFNKLPSICKMECIKNPNFKQPTAYDVLTCVQKYDPGTFENFCSEFGYDTDSRKSEKLYKAIVNEYQNIAMLYNDNEIEMLQEIQ